MPQQDSTIKNNPWLIAPLGRDIYRVPSASSDRTYLVDLAAGSCTCEAHKPCWHKSTCELRARLDVTMANCRRMYFQMRLPDLIVEDERLRELLAAHESQSLRAQLTALGDAIGVLVGSEVAA